ncbi:MAG TPA: alpha/beta fold hydrolase [Gemmataceae bacterium]|jgi:dipeptidyl aminopeptidase/acylaminoacyl peptidase|nr:alpha/beta fold hydrolase [Gemmataceae bacterium]
MTTRLLALFLFATSAYAEAPDRSAALKRMEEVMGPLPTPARKAPLDVQITSEEKLDGYVRKKLTYVAEEGDRVPAYLLIPTEFKDKRPAALCLHQTTAIGKGQPVGLDKDANKHYAWELVKRGYVCLVPDYPSFGDYKYDFKKSAHPSGTMKAIWNNVRGVDLLQSLPEVDGDRIAAIGHSLGGHNALFTAAFDERIKAVVTCCGFCSFAKYYGGNLKGWTSDRYMPRIASEYGNDPKRVPFEFADVLTVIAPRAILTVSPTKDDNFAVEGVKDVIRAVKPIYEKLGAADELQARYPDAGHDFLPEERKAAYEFLDRRLKP